MKKITEEQFVEKYSGWPESWMRIAETADLECVPGKLQSLGSAFAKAARDFEEYAESIGFEIG